MELSTIFINISLALTLLVLVLIYYMLNMRYKTKQITFDLNASIQENEKIHRFLDRFDTIIYTHDLSGKIEYVNASVQKILGLNPNQLFGTSFKTLIQQDHPQIWENYIQAIFRDQNYHCELKLLNNNGQAIPFSVRATGILEEGVVVAVNGHARVLTLGEKKDIKTKDSVSPKREAKFSEHLHQVFAHQIKNIFTAIYGFVEIIEENGHKSESLEAACSEIRAASRKGVKLVGEYLADPDIKQNISNFKSSKTSHSNSKRKSNLKTGKGKILYIDDEESLLKMYSKFIQKLGYEVDTSTSGIQALEAISNTKEPYGLVISDWMLPDLSGAELVRNIQERQPKIPIMLLSGKNIPEDERPIVHEILEKPVDPILLSERIYELINLELKQSS